LNAGHNQLFSKHRSQTWIHIAALLAVVAGILMCCPMPARPQDGQGRPLSLSQIERLIQVQAPDATIAAEIRQHGLNFAPGKETADTLRRLGAGPETLQAIDELRPMLDEAKQAIPVILTRLYQALDQGSLQAIRDLVSPQIAQNSETLDAICRPFTYKAHYIEAIIERPNQNFETRVHALFQPFHENVYVLTFHPYHGGFQLTAMHEPSDDWFGPAKEAAIQLARNFIYAAKAQRAEALANLVGPDVDVSRYTANPCWQELFQMVSEIRNVNAVLESHAGVKIAVHASVWLSRSSGEQAEFWIDSVGGQYKIVSAEPMRAPEFIFGMFSDPPSACRGVNRDIFSPARSPYIEQATLKRFGLPTSSTQQEQVYRVGGNVSAPVPTYKPEPTYTEAARKAKLQGTVVLSVDVDANGNVSNVNVAKSLGQDTRLSVRPEYSAPTVVKSLAAALDEKAVEAVKTWKFRPALRDGAPVAVRVSVDINFRTF